MSIYGSSLEFDFSKLKKLVKPVSALVIVIVVVYLLYLIALSFQPEAISASFSKNPLSLAVDSETLLIVNVTNVLDEAVAPIKVEVTPVDEKSIHVFPVTKTLSLLGQNESRRIEFLVKPLAESGEVLPGSYNINIKVWLGEKEFEKQVTLILQ